MSRMSFWELVIARLEVLCKKPEERGWRLIILWLHTGGPRRQQAWTFLAEEFRLDVYYFALYLARDVDVADDLMQQAFANFCDKSAAGQIRASHPKQVRRYLIKTVRNLFLLQKKKRETPTGPDELKDKTEIPEEGQETNPEEEVDLRRLGERIRKLLSPIEKEILLLRLEGYSYREIQKKTGVSYSTAWKKLKAVKKKIGLPEFEPEKEYS